jgi:hypothetical protein
LKILLGSRKKMDAELEKFKTEINLAEIATAYGYELDRKKSSRASFVMTRPDGDKIIVSTDTDGHGVFFSISDGSRSGSVIDFIKWQEDVNLGHARQVLRRWMGDDTSFFPTTQKSHLSRPVSVPRDCAARVAEWERMRPYRIGNGYLEKRGLIPDTIRLFSERIGVDQRGNVCFRHDDLTSVTGWEVKNQGFTGFAGGGKKALFGCKIGYPQKEVSPLLVFTESAIDTMSYYQLHPRPGFYLSIGGNMSPEQQELLTWVLNRYPQASIIIATDKDKDGELYADFIRSVRPDAVRAEPPMGKDWNDSLNQRQARAR